MIHFDFNKDCVGCAACESVCHKGAIRMVTTSEGFWIPKVEEKLCVGCGMCDRVCSVMSPTQGKSLPQPMRTLSVALKDKAELFNSASGGVFWGLATEFIKNGGYVAGCVWNEAFEAEYVVSNELQQVSRMRGSKYVQARPNDIAPKIKQLLKQGYKVLLTGTLCQIEGVRRYTGDSENLYTCGLICEGVSSPKVWDIYRQCIERQNGSRLTRVQMRSKKDGWTGGCSEYEFENERKKKYSYSYLLDPYVSGFIEGLYNRNCCKSCKFKARFDVADYLIGDFWGATQDQIQENENKGLSTLLICSRKGEQYWQEVSSLFESEEVPYEQVKKANNIEHSGNFSANRQVLFQSIDRVKDMKSFEKVVWSASGKYLKKKVMVTMQKFHLLDLAIKIQKKI